VEHLVKRSELRRNVPLVRSGIVRSKQQPTPLRRSTVNPVSTKRARDRQHRQRREAELGKVAGVGVCAMCGRHGEVHGHELDPAGYGKRWANPDVLLCNLDNSMVEDMPISAAWNGWKRSTKHPRDPLIPDGAARRADGSFHYFTGGQP
jgi:hypothetical protein